jgi:cystathionine beta-lyase/cystathionine gamma-synthase
MTHTGYNQEDSVLINKGSLDRGLFLATIYHTEKDEDKNIIRDEIIRCKPDPQKTKGIKWVRYPFLKSHPQYKIAIKQMSGGSGLIVADLGLTTAKTMKFLTKLHLFTQAESLGGIESLICHPATMTHASIPKEVRESVGITDGVVRFSVGIEHVEDLWADIQQALKAAK